MGYYAMKFMGSKRVMLENHLGELIRRTASDATRFVDPFCGAASVSWFAASQTESQVLASDLQAFAVVMANAVIGRVTPLNPRRLAKSWLKQVEAQRQSSGYWEEAQSLANDARIEVPELVAQARQLCKEESNIGPVWNAYGGYYFSPSQALTLDMLVAHLPRTEPARSVCLASTISAASSCAASPGHTAQPFRPTESAGPFLLKAWSRDPIAYSMSALEDICPQRANREGEAVIGDATEVATRVRGDDLVFLDPPYSSVQYSRFYHVLETIAVGQCSGVAGAGRYPPITERPQSDLSKKSKSRRALDQILSTLAEIGASVILTFPAGTSSNGLSGEIVTELADKSFRHIDRQLISGTFSTLGGNNGQRASRQVINELLLFMRP